MCIAFAQRLECPVDDSGGRGKIRITNAQNDNVFTATPGLPGEIVQVPDVGSTTFDPIGQPGESHALIASLV